MMGGEQGEEGEGMRGVRRERRKGGKKYSMKREREEVSINLQVTPIIVPNYG